jgi:hypothetical protein
LNLIFKKTRKKIRIDINLIAKKTVSSGTRDIDKNWAGEDVSESEIFKVSGDIIETRNLGKGII